MTKEEIKKRRDAIFKKVKQELLEDELIANSENVHRIYRYPIYRYKTVQI